jgi:hypothetical protein
MKDSWGSDYSVCVCMRACACSHCLSDMWLCSLLHINLPTTSHNWKKYAAGSSETSVNKLDGYAFQKVLIEIKGHLTNLLRRIIFLHWFPPTRLVGREIDNVTRPGVNGELPWRSLRGRHETEIESTDFIEAFASLRPPLWSSGQSYDIRTELYMLCRRK